MLALLLPGLTMYNLYKSGVISVSTPNNYDPLWSSRRFDYPIPNANVVAVQLPNAMECYNAVPKPCKIIRHQLPYPCFKTGF